MKNYYQILGIKYTANENDIYNAYRNKISQFNHLPFHTSQMINEIKSLKEALYVLSDDFRREKYDNKINRLNKYLEKDGTNSGIDNTEVYNRLFSIKFQ